MTKKIPDLFVVPSLKHVAQSVHIASFSPKSSVIILRTHPFSKVDLKPGGDDDL